MERERDGVAQQMEGVGAKAGEERRRGETGDLKKKKSFATAIMALSHSVTRKLDIR